MNFNEDNAEMLIKRKIFRNILKIHFVQLLRNTRLTTTKKLFMVNTYFLMLKKSFVYFKKKIHLVRKNKKDKKKIKEFQQKKFFNKIKSTISLIKNPNNRITSTHAYLFYFRELKTKIIKGLVLNYERVKMQNKQMLLLFGIRNKISTMYLYNEMKKKYKSQFFDEKIKNFNNRIALHQLVQYSKKKNKINECYRMYMRVMYIQRIKEVMRRFSIDYIRAIKGNEQTKINYIHLMLKKGIRSLRNETANKNSIIEKTEIFYLNQRKTFFTKISNLLQKRNTINKGVDTFANKICKIYNSRTFNILYRLYSDIIDKHKNKLVLYYLNLSIKKLVLFASISKKIKAINQKLLQYSYRKTYQHIHQLRINTELLKKHQSNKKQGLNLLNKTINAKLFKGLTQNLLYQQKKKEKFIKAVSFTNHKLKKKLFNTLKLYKIHKSNKKNEYKYIIATRNEIISNHLLENLIVLYSKHLQVKEEMISKEFINKSTRGIRTVLIWYNKLKSQIFLRKATQDNSSIKFESNPKNEKKFLDDFAALKSLRNKKRTAPIKLNI